jgi:adenylosuccinate synthase
VCAPKKARECSSPISSISTKNGTTTATCRIFAEGAQGFGLDIDWGDYPFVTSSHCTTAGALLNGLPPGAVEDVWGVAKIYETYVGSKKFQPKGAVFDKIGDIGEEFGATTGRRRQVNWMNMQTLEKAPFA